MRLKTFSLGTSLALAVGLLASTSAFALDTTRLAPKDESFSFEGPFGTYDRGALQRGYQVYKEVCSACHSAQHLAFHNLDEAGGPEFTEAQARALAAAAKFPADPNDKGETVDDKGVPLMRSGTLADHFPSPFPNEQAARANNGGALPPDLSMIVKAREGGPDYVYALMNGFKPPPAGFTVPSGKYYNEYFPGHLISMPPPLADGAVTYADGTKASVPQMAHDVATFLAWAAEPNLDTRHRVGVRVFLFLIVGVGVFYAAKRKIWSVAH